VSIVRVVSVISVISVVRLVRVVSGQDGEIWVWRLYTLRCPSIELRRPLPDLN